MVSTSWVTQNALLRTISWQLTLGRGCQRPGRAVRK
jgi:hypothetical protein